jgi:hypothetical protein
MEAGSESIFLIVKEAGGFELARLKLPLDATVAEFKRCLSVAHGGQPKPEAQKARCCARCLPCVV